MARSSECTEQYAQKCLTGIHIVRDACFRQRCSEPIDESLPCFTPACVLCPARGTLLRNEILISDNHFLLLAAGLWPTNGGTENGHRNRDCSGFGYRLGGVSKHHGRLAEPYERH